ncbi:hypothetical protein ASD25_08395 [Brevundimonas sp. Root1423]|nr:hypothetical protein ASD25_08395 [Brevundimonas sp. Root1423]
MCAVAAGLALGGCAQTVIVDPSWSSIPDGEAMSDAYPGFASWIGVSGWAQVRCRGDLLGNLAECRVIKAVPAGLGFDRAALALTPRFKMNPRQENGEVEKSSVEFTVRFLLPPEEPIVPWTGSEPSAETMALARIAASRMAETRGGPATRILADLDVDADRIEPVTAMVERVSTEYAARSPETGALMLARTGNLDQLRALAEGRRPPGPIPSREAIEAASAESEALGREFGQRLRERYCARYACPADGD